MFHSVCQLSIIAGAVSDRERASVDDASGASAGALGTGCIVAIAIDDGDGRHHIVKLKDPLALPAPETSASQAGAR